MRFGLLQPRPLGAPPAGSVEREAGSAAAVWARGLRPQLRRGGAPASSVDCAAPAVLRVGNSCCHQQSGGKTSAKRAARDPQPHRESEWDDNDSRNWAFLHIFGGLISWYSYFEVNFCNIYQFINVNIL